MHGWKVKKGRKNKGLVMSNGESGGTVDFLMKGAL